MSPPTPPHVLCCGAIWQSTTCISLVPSTFTNPNRSPRNLLPLRPSTRSELLCYFKKVIMVVSYGACNPAQGRPLLARASYPARMAPGCTSFCLQAKTSKLFPSNLKALKLAHRIFMFWASLVSPHLAAMLAMSTVCVHIEDYMYLGILCFETLIKSTGDESAMLLNWRFS